jgi:hypothetical protein
VPFEDLCAQTEARNVRSLTQTLPTAMRPSVRCLGATGQRRLIYLLAVALQSPKPTATVALARGLSPASGPKRVLAARKAGLLPETEPGKPAGA